MPHDTPWHSRRLRGLEPLKEDAAGARRVRRAVGQLEEPKSASQGLSGLVRRQFRTTVHCATEEQKTTVHNNESAVRKLTAIEAGKGSHDARGALHSPPNSLKRAAR